VTCEIKSQFNGNSDRSYLQYYDIQYIRMKLQGGKWHGLVTINIVNWMKANLKASSQVIKKVE